ncbi:uncharacterized protein LOC127137753 [Lathyrus oleraceus]|uniref:uncharacterized protein LOC127137753 n=1 Tax=Pisum sativum TaxID=3888 RepID=UPI0021D0380B|nr:uncharacterized protein LOC127137753 [Pisum sativum]
MLNEPTYPHLVNDLWVKAEFFYEYVASVELNQLVENDSSLKGKSREEVGLNKFEELKIRSTIMGVDVVITQNTIIKLLKSSNSRRLVVNTKDNSPKADAFKICLFYNAGSVCSYDFRNVKNMHKDFKLLFKILIGCLIPREGSTDQISWDYKHFILYLKNEYKINLSAYIFNHLCEAIKDSIKLRKKNVSYTRMLSELFYQDRLINALKKFPNNGDLEEIHGNIIYTSILANMKLLIKINAVSLRVPLSIIRTNPDYLEDYPVISKMDNPEVIRIYIEQAFKEGMIIRLKDLPNKPADVFHPSKKRKHAALVTQKDVQKPSKNKKEIE